VLVLSGVTVWVIAADVLGAYTASPAYAAVTAWRPAGSVAVMSWARPAPSTGPAPIWMAPSLNTTLPVETPPGAPCTDAVNVTPEPNVVVASEVATAVVVGFSSCSVAVAAREPA